MQNATKASALLVAVLFLSGPVTALGQEGRRFSLEGRAGVVFPVGVMADLTDLGASFGASAAFHFHKNWAIRGDFDLNKLEEGQDEFGNILSPPIDLTYFGGAMEVNFNPPRYQDNPLTFNLSATFGVTNMKVDETFVGGHPANGFDRNYFTMGGLGAVGWQFTRNINVFVRSGAYLILADSAETGPAFPAVGFFDTAWVIPLQGGVRLSF